MPTATDYRQAAARYRTTAEQLLRESAVVDGWRRAGLVGAGPVVDAVTDSVAEVRRHLETCGRELARLAVVCERRAVVCDAYADERRRYLALDPLRRLLVPAPPRPAPWVDA
jgi:hypothetical protein